MMFKKGTVSSASLFRFFLLLGIVILLQTFACFAGLLEDPSVSEREADGGVTALGLCRRRLWSPISSLGLARCGSLNSYK